jgi:O-acetyl-ADP-ribose deacetylase (regulator of RNase III)
MFMETCMISITYLTGDATKPQADGNKIIAHICNDEGKWGRGFVLAVSKLSPEPEHTYRKRYSRNKSSKLGDVQIVLLQDNPDLWVANMIAQRGVASAVNRTPIRYDALRKCLNKLAVCANACDASVHMPRIGCGLAGGAWDKVEPLIEQELCARDVHVYIYDLEYAA